MKKALLLIALCVTIVAWGEERKLLTMEDAILNRNLVPQNYDIRFNKDNSAIYEHANGGNIEQYDIRTGKLLSSKPILIGMPNPFRNKASIKDNNVVWYDGEGKIHKVTDFADKNIVCGQSVSRNEFGISGGLFPSPDNSLLAFYQKDESKVSTFPLLDITSRTGSLVEIKYPMNGMASERVSVGVYDVATQKVVYLSVTDFDEERYLTNVSWSPDSKTIYVQVLNRAQKEMHLNAYCAKTGAFIKTLLTEKNDRWVEPQNPIRFIDNDRFIYTTDNRDGFKNLYLYTLSKGTIERLTKVDADVKYVAHNDRSVFYYSAEVSPVEQHLFALSLRNGKAKQLTRGEGWHNCTVSPDGKYFSDNYSSLNVPRIVAVGSTDGKIYREGTEMIRRKQETDIPEGMPRWTSNMPDTKLDKYNYLWNLSKVVVYTDYSPRKDQQGKYRGNELPTVTVDLHLLDDGVERLYRKNRFWKMKGFSIPDEFYSPDYSKQPLPKADYRRTLYWNPNVKLDDNGRATINLYNNSSSSILQVSAEGWTPDGTPQCGNIN